YLSLYNIKMDKLNNNLLIKIFSYLNVKDIKDIINLEQTCIKFRKVIKTYVYKNYCSFLFKNDDLTNNNINSYKFVCLFVTKSYKYRGLFLEINIINFIRTFNNKIISKIGN